MSNSENKNLLVKQIKEIYIIGVGLVKQFNPKDFKGMWPW